MTEHIFIRRPGSSTLAVRVVKRRPFIKTAARNMHQAGIHRHDICHRLTIRAARLDQIIAPLSIFKGLISW